MKGLVCEAIGKVSLQEVPVPELHSPTGALVRITMTTICGSDVHLVHGHIPTEPGFVMGHEFVGVVEAVGEAVRRFKPGDRVTGPAAPYCGTCENCRAGQIQRCADGGVLGSGKPWGDLTGTHSEYTLMPHADSNLVRIPDALSDEQVLFVGDILSTGYHGVRQAAVGPGDTVVVMGAGPVGLCAVHTARLFGPQQIIAVDLIGQRLALAKRMGADQILNAAEGNVVQRVMELTGGHGPEAVVEAVGASTTLRQALQMVRVGGRVSMVGIPGEPMELALPVMFMKNVTLTMGLANLGDMETLIKLIAAGKLDTTPMITHRISLAEIESGFHKFEKQEEGVVKIAITP